MDVSAPGLQPTGALAALLCATQPLLWLSVNAELASDGGAPLEGGGVSAGLLSFAQFAQLQYALRYALSAVPSSMLAEAAAYGVPVHLVGAAASGELGVGEGGMGAAEWVRSCSGGESWGEAQEAVARSVAVSAALVELQRRGKGPKGAAAVQVRRVRVRVCAV